MFRWIALIVCLIAAALGLAVGVMNPEPVSLTLATLELELALGSLVVVIFIAGLATGLVLFLLLFHLPARWTARRLHAEARRSGLPDRHA